VKVGRSLLAPSNREVDCRPGVADHQAAVQRVEVHPVQLMALPRLWPTRTSDKTARPPHFHSSNKKPLSSPS
jgi:hypothetical protein